MICIQGDWSNVVDARIKGRLATFAMGGADQSPYTPLSARALPAGRPWGVTALFTEFTGVHEPLPLEWTIKPSALQLRPAANDTPAEAVADVAAIAPDAARVDAPPSPAMVSVLEFAKALNRLDAKALELAAGPAPHTPVDGAEVRKLVGTFWFGAVFARLSESWRERLFDALVGSFEIPNHALRRGRHPVTLANATCDELKELDKTMVAGPAATDVKLLLAIASLWGSDALKRVRFVQVSEPEGPSRLGSLFGLRG